MKKSIYIALFLSFCLSSISIAQVQTPKEREAKTAYIQGMEAFVNEEYDRATTLLLQAYNQLKGQSGLSFALADVYYQQDDLPNAALYGKEAVALEPENKWYRFKLAEIYRSAGQNQATLDELNKLLEFYPNDYDALFMLADTQKQYGQFLKSNQTLEKLGRLLGSDPVVLLRKFQNYEAIGDTESALKQLQELQKVEPDNLNTINLLGEYYSRSGKKNEAKKVLKDGLYRNSRDPQTLINLSGIYIDEQKWDSAGTLLGNFISDPIIEADQKLMIAQYMYTRQQNEPDNIQLEIETSRILDLYTESAPEYGPAFTLAGQFYSINNEPDKALENLARANELLPEDDIAWRQRLQLLLNERRVEEAIAVGIQADKNAPEDAFIQFFLGSAYLLDGNNAKAAEWLEKASRAPARRPFKSVIYGALGDAQSSLENYDESDRVYELAIRYDSENHNAMNNYAYNLSVRGENLERAKELALKAIELDAENAAYLDTVGWVYFKLEDYDRARRFIKASIDTGAASAEVYEHLGDVYEQLGDMNEAKKWWKQALDEDSTRTHLNDKI
ncbi:MAG: tetratricopeptide repeat protein [Balneolaceae bacterium]|nr:tetratricopeptide repeat protein [Balneolaceae bacterium]MBO6545249.1 tetratricopeptide repeat protein [Balneolaceae bacterium]MBO6646645.1 tetratricopeptide repeat protein [Balneolaceae bacterium]